MQKPYPLIWIFAAVGFAIFLMLWVFAQPNDDNAANAPAGRNIPPISGEPGQQSGTVGAGGAGSDATRGTPGPGTGTDRTR